MLPPVSFSSFPRDAENNYVYYTVFLRGMQWFFYFLVISAVFLADSLYIPMQFSMALAFFRKICYDIGTDTIPPNPD